jgi:YHS domain-containing protein
MVRAVLYLFLAIILISVLRSVLGVLGKIAGGLLNAGSPAEERPAGAAEPRKNGELKRDPVCGTYISTETSVKRTVNGQVVHFCSTACRDKYHPAQG